MIRKHREAGFTLVEIAIVLVIVGLLLGAVLKGQELIFNSKVKATYNLSREMSAAMFAYQDRYKMLPGDDTRATTRFPGATPATTDGNGDGFLNQVVNWNCTGVTSGDNCRFLHHLRLSGFIGGAGSDNPISALGGRVNIAQGNYYVTSASTSPSLLFGGSTLTHKAADAIDNGFDDGNPATGTFRCQNTTSYNMSTPDSLLSAACILPL
ncbi:MAG: type II secretion system protein [Burkholderiaceae bacterium]|nr:type II secretion system protein [Burkholderiaceae bacterium]